MKTGKLTQRRLQALVARQTAFVRACGAEQNWESIPKSPWFRIKADKPNPAQLQQADLTGLDLRGLELPCANLRLVVCVRQDLSGARLDGGLLREGVFTGSSFRSASLRRVDFTEARLEQCDFTGADLTSASFENADLTGARIDWSAVGPSRFRVTREDGLATGGYGEMEQDYTWLVIDQKNGQNVGRFEGHSYKCFFGSEPTQFSGVIGVKISEDALWMLATHDGGRVEKHALPPRKSAGKATPGC